MNRALMDRKKSRANRAYFQEPGHNNESPSEYYIRKSELLRLVYYMQDSEIIMEVMNSAPSSWTSILTTHLYTSLVEFQAAIRYHEEALLRSSNANSRRNDFGTRDTRETYRPQQNSRGSRPQRNTRTFLVGWSANLGKPQFPRDDSMVSKGKTPEDKGARPCRHCGSPKHWDNECSHARKGARQARANLARYEEEDFKAEEEYNELYAATDSEIDEDSNQQDFHSPSRD